MDWKKGLLKMPPPRFDLPLDDFASHFEPFLSQRVVIVSTIGKSDMVDEKKLCEAFRCSIPSSSEQPEECSSMCIIEGKYRMDQKVLYLSLSGPWDAKNITNILKRVIRDMKEMGFYRCWNIYTNACARALLFMFSMSHIVVIDHPSHTPDQCMLQLLRLLSFLWPKYQILLMNIFTRSLDCKDDWRYHGRLCSPRLLFVFKCPPNIKTECIEEEEQVRRLRKLERSIEDRIYLCLRKWKIVKYACNRAFYSIAPNDEFVFVGNPPTEYESMDEVEKFFRSFDPDFIRPDPFGSSNDEVYHLNDVSTTKKGHTLEQFLKKHITKAHTDGFYDNMGKYTHVKPFFQRPTLETWFEATNAILGDPDVGLGNSQPLFNAIFKYTNTLDIQSQEEPSRDQSAPTFPMAMCQTNTVPHRNSKGLTLKQLRQNKKDDERTLRIYKKPSRMDT